MTYRYSLDPHQVYMESGHKVGTSTTSRQRSQDPRPDDIIIPIDKITTH